MLRGSELDHPFELNLSPDLSTAVQAFKIRQQHKNDNRVDFIVSARIIVIPQPGQAGIED
jgi:hypothetical protein